MIINQKMHMRNNNTKNFIKFSLKKNVCVCVSMKAQRWRSEGILCVGARSHIAS